jgi:hypothetical protein
VLRGTMAIMGALRAAVCLVLVACTPASESETGLGGAGASESLDRPHEVEHMRLEQTRGNDIAPALSLACSDVHGTKENSWYRVFRLADFGIDGAFTVYHVSFGVQTSIGEQRVKVALGTYDGDAGSVELDTSKIDMLGQTTLAVPEGKAYMAQADFAGLVVPAGSNLVVEVKTEDRGDKAFFYLGATTEHEMIPGYLRAPTCNTPNPRMISALGYPRTHLVIAVSGAH